MKEYLISLLAHFVLIGIVIIIMCMFEKAYDKKEAQKNIAGEAVLRKKDKKEEGGGLNNG